MTPDQAKLLKMAEESIGAAKLLLDNDYQGFAASRAYYAMFSAAEALLLSKELSFSKHSAVIAAFGKQFVKSGMVSPELHRFILTAQTHRHAGDYGGERRVSRKQAEADIKNAEEFLRAVLALLAPQA